MNKQKSFTLIELLVVIVIIGILAGVITLSVSSNIAKAQDTKISASILSLNKILKTESVFSFPIKTTPCNLKDSCTNLKAKIDVPKTEDDIYYVTSTSGDYFALYGAKKSDATLYFKIDSNTESVASSGSFVDSRDNNAYKTVMIGAQEWMAENLKYLPSVVGPATGSESLPYYYVYGYDGTSTTTAKAQTNYITYGALYNWPAAVAACPIGWHLPSDEEFKTLEIYLGMSQAQADATGWRGADEEGGKLKESGTAYWASPNTGAINTSGFTALGAGFRNASGSFNSLKGTTYYWSSTFSSTSSLWNRYLTYSSTQINRSTSGKAYGWSIRCIKD